MNNPNISSINLRVISNKIGLRRGVLFGVIILTALMAFELFNYSTTDYALRDLLGEMDFLGIRWATILAIAFCGIDFAGIARLFTPEQGADEPKEVWYLFGAWMLAATMNAMLTWWGVSLAVLSSGHLENSVLDRNILLRIVPVFVAILVWLIRVLIIGTFSVAGERIFSQEDHSLPVARRVYNRQPGFNPGVPASFRGNQALPSTPKIVTPPVPQRHSAIPTPFQNSAAPGKNPVAPHPGMTGTARPARTETSRPAPPPNEPEEPAYIPVEPTYHPLSARSVSAAGPNAPTRINAPRSFAVQRQENIRHS